MKIRESSSRLLTAGLYFAMKGPGKGVLGAYVDLSFLNATASYSILETTSNSSKADDATNSSERFVNEMLFGPHPESHAVRLPLEMMAEQPCNARESSDFAAGESIDPACVMLFQMNHSQHCTRRLPPVNAHTEHCRPDFFILGTRKGGSTSLYAYVTSHPNVYHKPVNEGLVEETLGENFERIGSEAYNHEYSGARPCQYVLDSTVSRLVIGAKDLGKYCKGQHKSTDAQAGKIPGGIPMGTEPRFIVLLREPVRKCYSRLSMQTRLGIRRSRTDFDREVSSELNTFMKNTQHYKPLNVIEKSSLHNRVLLSFKHSTKFNCLFESAYAMHLAAFLRLFKKNSIRIYFSDNLFDPNMSMSVLEDCFKFLGLLPLKAAEMESILQFEYNTAPKKDAAKTFSLPVVRSIQRTMSPWNSELETFLGSIRGPMQNKVAVAKRQSNSSLVSYRGHPRGPSSEKIVANSSNQFDGATRRRFKKKKPNLTG